MSDTFSADTDDLDRFADRSQFDVAIFENTFEGLLARRGFLAGLPLSGFVESRTLDRYRDLVQFMGENGRFVRRSCLQPGEQGSQLGKVSV